MTNRVLHCLICGYERGGTTLLSELIRQNPRIDGRFECGFLLRRRPADFATLQPYADNLKTAWGVDARGLAYICAASGWEQMYRRLREVSALPDKTIPLYDKTPRYMSCLPAILAKVTVPCVVIVRDPRAVFYSHSRHNPTEMGGFCGYYLDYGRAFVEARKRYPGQILLVRYERLCLQPESEARRIFDFLGLEFDLAYLDLPRRADDYVNPRIDTRAIAGYADHLTLDQQRDILRRTAEFSCWHWTGVE